VRQLSREASLQPSPFADSIGQFRGIHFFRFAVVRLDARAHLLLNVTVDGGWESYMRVVWKPLGAFLDLIFCHCEGYPMAFRTDYNQYIRWVREHEVESSFFYADSAATVADEHYLRRLESIQLESGGHPNYDILGAGCALPAQPPNAIPSVFSAIASLRVLTAVGKLREFFPVADDTYQQGPEKVDPFNQAAVLKRFARDLLVDLRSWVQSGLFDPGHQFETLRANLEVHRAWLMTKPNPDDSDQTVKKPEFYGKDVQAGIHQSYPPLGPECGGLVAQAGLLALVRVRNSVAAREWLVDPANVTKADDTSPPKDCIYRNIAITRSGLDVLGIPASDRAALPRDFLEGMEERAGLLGDVRFNHPSAWKRPRRNWEGSKCASFGPPIALSSVHLVLQFRGLESDELFNRISELDSVFDVLAGERGAFRTRSLRIRGRDQPAHARCPTGITVLLERPGKDGRDLSRLHERAWRRRNYRRRYEGKRRKRSGLDVVQWHLPGHTKAPPVSAAPGAASY
jgi:hypothetical protein